MVRDGNGEGAEPGSDFKLRHYRRGPVCDAPRRRAGPDGGAVAEADTQLGL